MRPLANWQAWTNCGSNVGANTNFGRELLTQKASIFCRKSIIHVTPVTHETPRFRLWWCKVSLHGILGGQKWHISFM